MLTKPNSSRLYVDEISISSRMRRLWWEVVYFLFFRWTPRFGFNRWRIFLLRCFGAKIGPGCKVAASCAIWAPWNLSMGAYVCLADGVDCYTMARVTLGDYATVSQRAFLCTGSHDIKTLQRPLVTKPIVIGAHAWVCAESYVAPGVVVGEGGVVGARAVLTKSLGEWQVAVGNPAVVLKRRILEQ